MSKFVAACLLLTALLFSSFVGCAVYQPTPPDDFHLGPVMVRNVNGLQVEFIKPDGAIFEAAFAPHSLATSFYPGEKLKDVVYEQDKAGSVFRYAYVDETNSKTVFCIYGKCAISVDEAALCTSYMDTTPTDQMLREHNYVPVTLACEIVKLKDAEQTKADMKAKIKNLLR